MAYIFYTGIRKPIYIGLEHKKKKKRIYSIIIYTSPLFLRICILVSHYSVFIQRNFIIPTIWIFHDLLSLNMLAIVMALANSGETTIVENVLVYEMPVQTDSLTFCHQNCTFLVKVLITEIK